MPPSRSCSHTLFGILCSAGFWLFLSWGANAQLPTHAAPEWGDGKFFYPLNTWEVPDRSHYRRASPRTADQRNSHTTVIDGKLQSIIIPNAEFRKTKLIDAIDFLRQESRRLDPDMQYRGVTILLDLPPPGTMLQSSPAASLQNAQLHPPDSDTRITLTLTRIPLLEALRYVAKQAGLEVKVGEDAVSLVPLSDEANELITAEFIVEPETFAATSLVTAIGTIAIGSVDADTWLKGRGITFPIGAVFVYLPRNKKLIVRNTRENIARVKDILSF